MRENGSHVSFAVVSPITASGHAAQLARVTACEQRDYHQHDVYARRHPLTEVVPGDQCMADAQRRVAARVYAGEAEETGAMTWGLARPLTPAAGFRCRTVIGDYRPLPTTSFRCEGCGAGAYRPLAPEEPVLCDDCLKEAERA